jgi:hypothetical protein
MAHDETAAPLRQLRIVMIDMCEVNLHSPRPVAFVSARPMTMRRTPFSHSTTASPPSARRPPVTVASTATRLGGTRTADAANRIAAVFMRG